MDDIPPRWPNWHQPSGTPSPSAESAVQAAGVPLGSFDTRLSIADIRSIVGVLLRRWKSIAIIPIACACLAGLVLYFIPPQYRSTVQILVADPSEPTNAASDKKLSSLDVDAAAVASEVAVMQSRSVLLAAVQKLGLDKDPEINRVSSLSALLAKFGFGGADSGSAPAADAAPSYDDAITPQIDRAIDALQRRVTVEREQFSYVLSESVLAQSPEKARRIAATVAEAYLNNRLEARYEAAQRATTWLGGRLADLRQRVASDDAAIAKLKADNNLADTGGNTNLNQQQISDINGQLILARADAAEKRARYDQVSRAVTNPGSLDSIPEVMASPVIGQLRLQQATLSQQTAELQSHFGDRYPGVINAKSQLADTSRQISAEVGRIVNNVKNQYDIADQRVQSLTKSLAAVTGQAGNSQALLQLQDLQRTAEANRKMYEYFLNQYNEIDQTSTLSDTGARIISAATLPKEIASPRRTLILFLATFAGLLLGIVTAFLAEHLDTGFKTSLQIEQTVGRSVLGMVPKIKGSLLHGETEQMAMLKYLLNSPFSQLSEAIRSIRMGVALSNVDHPPHVILVNSSVPNEGKTTVAMLIAASAAVSRQKAILIDCDLRRRSISKALGLKDKPGLVEVLADNASLSDVVIQDESAHFSILPAGTQALNIVDLLSSNRMRDLIAELRTQYDCVVLDVAPLMAVVDGVVLARLVDKILLVVEWSQTPRATVHDSLELLNREPGKVAGVILNKVDFKRLRSHGYGYGYGYNCGYYYRDMDKYYQQT